MGGKAFWGPSIPDVPQIWAFNWLLTVFTKRKIKKIGFKYFEGLLASLNNIDGVNRITIKRYNLFKNTISSYLKI